MSCRIAPSILSFDHSRLRDEVAQLASAGAERIHFDVMDGQFVPPITFGDGLVSALRDAADLTFEAHLMTQTPERHFEAFAKAGCARIYFHAESTVHAHRLVQTLRKLGVEPALAINPATPVAEVEPLINDLDAVLVMTVNPGWGGQGFIESMLPKIRAIRALRPDVDIEVDGGIDPVTLPKACAAGANLFVVGNYLAKASSMQQAMAALQEACC
jgi:ribulose-phosphate 3-epimerase